MRADIFIPTSNRVDALRECLDSLQRQSLKDFRILLVGLYKDEKIERLLELYCDLNIEYFIQKSSGLILAANEALERASNEIFVRIDDDTVMDDCWYQELISTYINNPDVLGVTGPTVMSKKGLESRDLTAYLEKMARSKNFILRALYKIYYEVIYEGKIKQVSMFLDSGSFTLGSNYPECKSIKGLRDVNNLEACNWSAKTEALRSIGGFDLTYLKGLGDYHEADAALSILNLGGRLVFNPNVSLKHNVEVGKVEKARPAPYWRMQNFIFFYFKFFKFKSFKQIFRVIINIALQNGYYFFKFLTTGRINQLGAIPGTFVGIFKVLFMKLLK